MKIVFVVPDMTGGGTEKVISLLANEYVKRGIDVGILLFAGNEVAYPLDERVEVYSAGAPSGGSAGVRIKRLKSMRRYFKANRGCRIFSFSTIGTGFIVLSTFGMKRKMLVSERTDPQTCDHKPYRNFFYRWADVLVCQTADAVRCFPAGLRKKAMVLANPVDPELPEPFTGERKKWVVTAGRLQPVKNQAMLIRAFASFSRQFPEFTLHLFGKGDLESFLRELAAKCGIQDKTVFHGFCPDVKQQIADSGMFVLSSDYEGISNSMAEALAMGIPVIATDCPIGGCRMYISDGENGLLVPVGGEKELTEAMKRVAGDTGLAARLSARGSMEREKHSVKIIADQLLDALEKGPS